MKAYIIGAGGVGSWMTPALCLLIGKENVAVIDGDTLEDKNLNRQLFTSMDVGRNKAECLAEKYGCEHSPGWFSFGVQSFEKDDWLISAVDNHPARLAVIETCDLDGCKAMFAANETHSSEAYVYLPEWKSTNLDPRRMYPEILTDTAGDPRRAAIGCTGEAQEANRQLVTANFMAAGLALHLFVVWAQETKKMPAQTWKHLPHKLVQNLSKSESFKAIIN